eukprot:TRINITY_DN0_c4502_g1_i1.p1 TRINITY_DN0_c4502_g1~~TRINITY_DN0_c4502_g1_i1.p1  ORF type:complete len:108 (-),score=17.26 TRINITY_DN0_c4502_g1_i1:97-420(-)
MDTVRAYLNNTFLEAGRYAANQTPDNQRFIAAFDQLSSQLANVFYYCGLTIPAYFSIYQDATCRNLTAVYSKFLEEFKTQPSLIPKVVESGIEVAYFCSLRLSGQSS